MTKQYINCTDKKVPFDPDTGEAIDHLNPGNWRTRDEVSSLYLVSYVLNGSGVWCLDIDKCIDNGQLNAISKTLLQLTQAHSVYIEQSVSGTGLHVWGRYEGTIPPHGNKNTSMAIELYTDERHVVLGQPVQISPLSNFEKVLNAPPSNSLFEALVYHYFLPGKGVDGELYDLNDWVHEDNGIDWKKISRRKTSTNANPFSGALSLVDLYSIEQYDWESSDKSSLDMAILNHLAFNTDKNHEAIKRLYLASNIGKYRSGEKPNKLERNTGRDVNGTRITYLQRSILRAVAECENTYKTPTELKEEKQAERIEELRANMEGERGEPDSPAGYYLRDFVCVYNGTSPEYIDTRGGNKLGKQTFKDCFRIDGYEFEQAFSDRVLSGVSYHPGKPPIVNEDTYKILNTWRPGPVPEPLTDTTCEYLDLLFNILAPIDEYRKHLKMMVAYAVCKPGVKIQQSLLLYGRATGTGKSLLLNLISKGVGRHNASKINNRSLKSDYNGWSSKQFVYGDELNVNAMSRSAAMNAKELLKSLITDEEITVNEKYETERTQENPICFTGWSSNEEEALIIDHTDRRYFCLEVPEPKGIKIFGSVDLMKVYSHLYKISGGEFVSYCKTIDTNEFNPELPPPRTIYLDAVVEHTLDDSTYEIKNLIGNCDYIDDEFALASRIAQETGIGTKAVGRSLRKLGYINYRSQNGAFWLKEGIERTPEHTRRAGLLRVK